MNARENTITPLRTKIAAHLDAAGDADADQIAKAVGLSDRPSAVIKELNSMRTDALVECENRKKRMVYWLAVPVAQIDATAASESSSQPSRPDGIRAGTRAAQIWDVLRDDAKLTAREIASILQCASGALDPVISTLYKNLTISRTKGPDGVYRYHRPAAESNQGKPQAAPTISDDAEPWHAPELQYLAAEDYVMPPADPVLLAKANRMLAERLARVAHVLRGCGLPALAEIGCGEDLQMATAALAGAYQAKLSELDERCRALDAIREHLAPLESIIDPSDLSEIELARRAAETIITLRDTVHKITEGDDAVDVLQAATGFVVLASKRKPRRIKRPEAAREAAMSAIRSGAQRAGVFALVPVGEARRGAVWMDS
ncbi:hypothetical protein J5J83_19900 [Azoarcus sp. L1K30]|uniref:hypothetical protein n=1 Tax=Azoarcus sp. L1K30 TaxID=2820277 RepID=UPI001B83538E|nr:hypothetical protein [Azoarcus sp. L1K30]MBR0568392.1 hypothetical protein [Azoarcus sp. L1K30]